MPDGRIFVDTNVLLYIHDRRQRPKAAIVVAWLRPLTDLDLVAINLQVLNEAANVMIRGGWFESPRHVYAIIDELADMGSEPVGWREVVTARSLHVRLGYSWWDCLLLASALEMGCTHFLSEDLQDEQRIELADRALTIVSPFAHSPDEILTSR